MDKKELRKKYIEIRKNIPDDIREKQSAEIVNRLSKLIDENGFSSVFMYAPKDFEVDVMGLFESGKKVKFFFPRCEKDIMDFYEVNDISDLEIGSFNVREPKTFCRKAEYKKNEKYLIVVPGVAFDEKGYRIGYGKGFYDKFLDARKEYDFYKVGVCFKECFTSDVFHDEFDVKMDETIN